MRNPTFSSITTNSIESLEKSFSGTIESIKGSVDNVDTLISGIQKSIKSTNDNIESIKGSVDNVDTRFLVIETSIKNISSSMFIFYILKQNQSIDKIDILDFKLESLSNIINNVSTVNLNIFLLYKINIEQNIINGDNNLDMIIENDINNITNIISFNILKNNDKLFENIIIDSLFYDYINNIYTYTYSNSFLINSFSIDDRIEIQINTTKGVIICENSYYSIKNI